jgi:hypothetical protein
MERSPLLGAFRMGRYVLSVAAVIGVLSAAYTKRAFAAPKTFTCNPVDVSVFANRIHVRCSPGDGSILFFALGTTNTGHTNRTLSMLSTAFIAQKKLAILYDPADVSGANVGCQTKDCRLIIGVTVF